MSLNFFKEKSSEPDGLMVDAINTISIWMNGRPHLPKDLVAALFYALPELKIKRPTGLEGFDADF